MKKGNFLRPEIYKFAKTDKKEFIIKSGNKNLNIRNSFFIKKFQDRIFHVHNGRYFSINDPDDFKTAFKNRNHYGFKIGQLSYNRQLIERRRGIYYGNLFRDLKRKKGTYIKGGKKKKYIYYKI